MADQTVTMTDGKDVRDVPLYQVEYFKSKGAKVVEPPPPMTERGGITAPMTSMLAPELEGARSALNKATATPSGTPIMARSRTGTLYPSETGTGAANAAKNVVKGAGGALIDQAEGVTSPLGLATSAGSSLLNPAVRATTGSAIGATGRGVEQVGQAVAKPAKYVGTWEMLTNPAKGAVTVGAPYAIQGVGRGMQKLGALMAPAEEAAAGLSAADKALLVKQGWSDADIARAGQAAAARPAPIAAPAANAQKWPIRPQPDPDSQIVPETGETMAAWRARIAARNAPTGQPPPQPPPAGGDSPIAQQLKASLAARQAPAAPAPTAPIRAVEGRPAPLYPSAGTVKGVTSNALETASNAALAAGHWDEAERLIGQSLHAFFQGSGGPMAGILAAAIAHKARQVVEPLRADPSFQQAPPAKQQQMIQNALRQPGARGALTSLLGTQ